KTIEFAKKRISATCRPEAARISRLINDLDKKQFVVRQTAIAELEKIADIIMPQLETGLKLAKSEEAKKQIARLLDPKELQPEMLRLVRAVFALEHIGTAAAQDLLDKLTKGSPASAITNHAKMALDRLRRYAKEN